MEAATAIDWNEWDAEHKQLYTSIEMIQLLKEFFKKRAG